MAPNIPVAVLLGRETYPEVVEQGVEVVQGLLAVTRSQSRKAEQVRERGCRRGEEVMAGVPFLLTEEAGEDEDVDELRKEGGTEE